MAEPTAEKAPAWLTKELFLGVFDLHGEVLRANRRLDSMFPPYTDEQFAAIRDAAERLQDRAEALRALLDKAIPSTDDCPTGDAS